MTDRKNMSIMELANQILLDNEKAMTFSELYDLICTEKGLSEEEKAENISQVYSDFIASARFIYVGDDEWDIKGRQTIDLWDKDGAYYDEYPDYEEELSLYDSSVDDEYSIDEEEDVDIEDEDEEEEDVPQYEDDFDEDDIDDDEDSEYDAFVDDDEDYIEDEEDLIFDDEDLEDDEDYEADFEEDFEEETESEEDFDDEEYNEYMDDYEQMYDD
jgi:DNA-directed RNA polymerase subunit delta